MADDILLSDGDEITADRLRTLLGRAGVSGYVESGLAVSADYTAAVTDITTGTVHILYQDKDYTIQPDARAGKPIGTDGTNHVYAALDVTQQADGSETLAFEYRVNQTGTDPDGPTLEIAQINMGTQETTPTNRTAPVASKDAESYKGRDLDSDGDGKVDAADAADSAASAEAVPGSGVSGRVNAARVTDAIVDAQYGDLASGELIHTKGALSSRATTLETDATWSISRDGADDTAIEYDAGTGKITIGKAEAQPVLAANLNADGYRIRNVDHLSVTGGSNDGFVIAPNYESDTPAIIPYINGSESQGDRLQYDIGQDLWQFRSGVGIFGRLHANAGVETTSVETPLVRAVENPDTGDGILLDADFAPNTPGIVPFVNGAPLRDFVLAFDPGENRWRFSSDLKIINDMETDGKLTIGGAWVELPKRTSDPTNAPTGAMWIRTDKF